MLGSLGCHPRPPPPTSSAGASGPARVVVVGAGLAGLTSAFRLQQAGFEVVVVEATSRAGGRVKTHVEPGLQIELGATRMLGSHPHVADLAASVGVDLVGLPGPRQGTRPVYLVGGRRFVGAPEAWPLDLPVADRGASPGELIAKYLRPGVELIGDPSSPTWPGPELRELDQLTRRDFIRSQGGTDGVVHLLEMGQLVGWVERVGALQSLRFSWGNDFSTKLVARGGNERLIEALCAAIAEPIRFRAPVRRIEERPGGVVVCVGDSPCSTTLKADLLVCCVPLSTLGAIEFIPSLSQSRQHAFATVPHVNVARVNCIFEGRPWLDRGLSGEVVADNETMEVWDLSTGREGDPGVLTFYVTGTPARALLAMSEHDRKTWCADRLSHAMGELPALQRTITQAWPHAWASYEPTQITRHLHALSAATARVAFATDALSPWPGWQQGAVFSALAATDWVTGKAHAAGPVLGRRPRL